MPREKNGNPKNPRKRGKWKPKGAFDIQQLPQALVMDILSRLSIKTLYNCRCVCKDWLHMICDPQFANVQCLRSPISILIRTNPRAEGKRKLGLVQIEKCAGSRLRVERMRFAPQNSLPVSTASEVLLINSCNGLVCLAKGPLGNGLYVCNPILGEYISIPSPDKSITCWFKFVGLGFNARTNEYKVLQTCSNGESQIYTIGTGVWRSIGKAPGGSFNRVSFNSFLHGALHWVPYSFDGSQFIQSFNFETEQFRPLPPPFKGHLKLSKHYNHLKLGVLKGCLFLCEFGASNSEFDMWVMKDYGVQESWTKILVIENLYPWVRYGLHNAYEPIVFFNDGEILMTYKDRVVVRYNHETKTVSRTGIIQTRSQFRAIAYCPCFVSLHHVSNGEEVVRVRDNNKFEELFAKGSYSCAGSSKSADHKSKKLKSGSGQPALGNGSK
ncbi:F-box protein [Rosa sericea]